MAVNRSAMSTRAILFGLLASVSTAQVAQAVSPKSPEVKNMVSRAVSFLGGDFSNDTIMNQAGALSLVGLAVLKAKQPKNHPAIKKALDFIFRSIISDTKCSVVLRLGTAITKKSTIDTSWVSGKTG